MTSLSSCTSEVKNYILIQNKNKQNKIAFRVTFGKNEDGECDVVDPE